MQVVITRSWVCHIIIMILFRYIVFRALYQMMITVASFEVASNIGQSR